MKIPSPLIYGCVLLVFCACLVCIEPGMAQDRTRTDIYLTPGDAVTIYVYEGLFPTDRGKFLSTYHNTEYIIDGSGSIHLGPLGKVQVAGLKPEEIAQVLQEKFKPYAKDPIILVAPLLRISLKGGFTQPGLYRFNPDMSFWEMIKQVGGIHGGSSFEDMYIIRKDRVINQQFEDAFYRGQSLAELGLQSGDEIVVPRVNRLSFDSLIRYIQFGMSLLIFYFSFINYNSKQ